MRNLITGILKMKRILSYLFPVKLKTYISAISGTLEVTLRGGKKELNTLKCNYSYGYLQKVLKEGLKRIRIDNSINKILVLGMGAGSVVETIRKNFLCQAHLTLVEIDPEIIKIAEKEFNLHKFGNLTIIEANAFDFVSTSEEKYDLIIVDVFIQDKIPVEFFGEDFLSKTISLLNPNGRLVYNTMRNSISGKIRDHIKDYLTHHGMQCTIAERIEGSNDLILGFKSSL